MSGNVKTVENMTKNMTLDERMARENAEAETLPNRVSVLLPPSYLKKDKVAEKYWEVILSRMVGISLLDDLDTEMLAIYCTMLSRRDSLNALCRVVLVEASKPKLDTDARLDVMSRVDGLVVKLQSLERTILQYADKLGLTPSGRVRLARKRAEAAMPESNEDLFGD